MADVESDPASTLARGVLEPDPSSLVDEDGTFNQNKFAAEAALCNGFKALVGNRTHSLASLVVASSASAGDDQTSGVRACFSGGTFVTLAPCCSHSFPCKDALVRTAVAIPTSPWSYSKAGNGSARKWNLVKEVRRLGTGRTPTKVYWKCVFSNALLEEEAMEQWFEVFSSASQDRCHQHTTPLSHVSEQR